MLAPDILMTWRSAGGLYEKRRRALPYGGGMREGKGTLLIKTARRGKTGVLICGEGERVMREAWWSGGPAQTLATLLSSSRQGNARGGGRKKKKRTRHIPAFKENCTPMELLRPVLVFFCGDLPCDVGAG